MIDPEDPSYSGNLHPFGFQTKPVACTDPLGLGMGTTNSSGVEWDKKA
jgi:hypothetical protein